MPRSNSWRKPKKSWKKLKMSLKRQKMPKQRREWLFVIIPVCRGVWLGPVGGNGVVQHPMCSSWELNWVLGASCPMGWMEILWLSAIAGQRVPWGSVSVLVSPNTWTLAQAAGLSYKCHGVKDAWLGVEAGPNASFLVRLLAGGFVMYLSPSQSPNVTFCPVTDGSWRKGNKAFFVLWGFLSCFWLVLLMCRAGCLWAVTILESGSEEVVSGCRLLYLYNFSANS